jgi:hypothetical protein
MASDSWQTLAITIAIETPVVAAVAARYRLPIWRIAALSVILNLITQPLLSSWLHYVLLGQDYLYWRYLAAGELCVSVVEAGAYALLLRGHRNNITCGLVLSGFANGASLLIGLILPF